MAACLAAFQLPGFPEHISLYGFFAVALVLLGLVCLDVRRAAKAEARKTSCTPFAVFFDTGEDPPERSAHRTLMQRCLERRR